MLYNVCEEWMKFEYGVLVEWHWQGKIEIFEDKRVPVPHCPPQIPHWLAWDRNRTAEVRRVSCTVDANFHTHMKSVKLMQCIVKFCGMHYLYSSFVIFMGLFSCICYVASSHKPAVASALQWLVSSVVPDCPRNESSKFIEPLLQCSLK
jgi:hypothetical protein